MTNAPKNKVYPYEHGEFLKDWLEKLPFKELGLKENIEVVNHHWYYFKGDNFGQKKRNCLVIIDEVQVF